MRSSLSSSAAARTLFTLLFAITLEGAWSTLVFRLIVLDAECNLCLKAQDNGPGQKLVLADCDVDDSLQLWNYDDKYANLFLLKRRHDDNRYCIKYSDEELFLERCQEGEPAQEFTYDTRGKNVISPLDGRRSRRRELGGYRDSGGINLSFGFGKRDDDSGGSHYSDDDDDYYGRHHNEDDDDGSGGSFKRFGNRQSGGSHDYDDDDDYKQEKYDCDDDDDDDDKSGGSHHYNNHKYSGGSGHSDDDDDDDDGGSHHSGGSHHYYKNKYSGGSGHSDDDDDDDDGGSHHSGGSHHYYKNKYSGGSGHSSSSSSDSSGGSHHYYYYSSSSEDDSSGNNNNNYHHGGGDSYHHRDDKDYMLLVLKDDAGLCACIDAARVGEAVALCDCIEDNVNSNDSKLQQWDLSTTSGKQLWRPRNNGNLCVYAKNGSINLVECTDSQFMWWSYDEYGYKLLCQWVTNGSWCVSTASRYHHNGGNGDDSSSSDDDAYLCMTYERRPQDGEQIRLKDCDDLSSDEKRWIFVDQDGYDDDGCDHKRRHGMLRALLHLDDGASEDGGTFPVGFSRMRLGGGGEVGYMYAPNRESLFMASRSDSYAFEVVKAKHYKRLLI